LKLPLKLVLIFEFDIEVVIEIGIDIEVVIEIGIDFLSLILKLPLTLVLINKEECPIKVSPEKNIPP